MSTERDAEWLRLEEAFEAVLALPAGERSRWIEAACGADAAFRARLERMLASHDASGGVLDVSVRRLHAEAETSDASRAEPLEGEEIGGYRILGKIAAGGMGIVYEAEQHQPQRRVALKVLHRGYLSDTALRRFDLEGQILANLKHPGIAQVYGVGVHRHRFGELPYIAMELVPGRPLTEYAASADLGSRERIELVIKVCDAVAHAHRKGVIHRDLKPANILVDDSAQPKVLDFGVARVTDADVETASLMTDSGQLVGTVPYMSPEQASGDPRQLDTRSDVYALGILLYEILAGRLPYDVRGKLIPEAVRVIREDEPTPLSSLGKAFRGDLDTITRKALEKDRERRYGSATELAEDLRRYLRDEPIQARPPSAFYQIRKFAARNRALVSGAAAALLLLVLGTVGTGWQALRARRSQDEALRLAASEAREKGTALAAMRRAEEDRDTAQRVSDFLSHLFAMISPLDGAGPDVKVLDVIDHWVHEIPEAFPDRPAVQVQLLNAAGSAYFNLGVVERGAAHIELAYKLATESLAEDDPQRLDAAHNMAMLLFRRKQVDEAEKVSREAFAGWTRAPGESKQRASEILGGLGGILSASGRLEEGESLLRRALNEAERGLGAAHYMSIHARVELAQNLWSQGRQEEAERVLVETLDGARASLGGAAVEVARLEARLASFVLQRMRPADAEPLSRHAVRVLNEKLGPSNAQTLSARHGLALSLREKGNLDEAETLLQRLIVDLEGAHDAQGEDDMRIIRVRSRVDLARVLGTRGDLAAAEAMYREALREAEAGLGEAHEDTLAVLSGLAYQLVLARRFEEARGLFEKALAGQSRVLGQAHLATVRTRNGYGFCYFREGRFPEAEAVFLRQIELLEPRQGPAFELWRALSNLAFVLQQEGELDEVEAVCPRAVEVGYACLPPDFGELDALEATWVLARHQRKGLEGVEELLLGLWRELSLSRGADDGHARRILRRLVRFYRSVGNTQEAERYEAL